MKGKVANPFTLHFQNDRSLSKMSRKIICRCWGPRQIIHWRDRKQSPWSVIASSIKPWVNGRKQGTIHISSNLSLHSSQLAYLFALSISKNRSFKYPVSFHWPNHWDYKCLSLSLSSHSYMLRKRTELLFDDSGNLLPLWFKRGKSCARMEHIIVHGPDRIFLPVLGTNYE